jgi:hypothetical protein
MVKADETETLTHREEALNQLVDGNRQAGPLLFDFQVMPHRLRSSLIGVRNSAMLQPGIHRVLLHG